MVRNFVGRKRELKALQDKYDQEGFHLAIIYGRRRIGKTRLINEFIKKNSDVRSIEFVAMERNEKDLLKMMTNAVLAAISPSLVGNFSFENFDKLFDFVGQAAKDQKIIFFIDEYPYLANECKYMNSLMQKYVDRDWKDSNLFVILCGSMVSFMRDDVLSENAPLHGRSDLEFKLGPFDYYETGLFLPEFSNEDKAIAYGITGGVAKYIEQINPEKSIDENIMEQFYSNTGYFTEEQVQTVMTADKKNPTAYNSIIAAIANGHTKYGEIASASGISDITFYIKNLMSAELIEKRKSGKSTYYRIMDGMLNFWFRLVSDAASLINAGKGELYYHKIVKEKMHDYMGLVFEDMARQYIFRNSGSENLPMMITSLEEYQQSIKEGKEIHQIEIDLVGREGKNIALAGECKFRRQTFSKKDMQHFLDKVRYLPATNPLLILFSLSGYEQGVKDMTQSAILIDIDMMYQSPEMYK